MSSYTKPQGYLQMNYESVIGLEIHAQLDTHGKIFCRCSTLFGASPNSQTCPVCLGLPGVLPVLNRKTIEYALQFSLAVGAKISERCNFHRKNYFYPDLPKAYQISQYDQPLARGGKVEIEIHGKKKSIDLVRIHLEEDAGKLIHSSAGTTLVDYNRCGVPLIEIVSEPQINSPEEAYEYLVTLKSILQYSEVCDCDMEKGSLRCDANISVRPENTLKLGTKVELKNINSFKAVQRALYYEIKRQTALSIEGKKIIQETRLWDEKEQITISMRTKEEAHDYRYFPEPDLAPIVINRDWLNEIRSKIPELPNVRKERFVKGYNLPPYDADVLSADKYLADFYEEVVKLYSNPKQVSNWIMTELLAHLGDAQIDITNSPLKPAHIAQILKLINDGTISTKMAKEIFAEAFHSGVSPQEIVSNRGLIQITDKEEIIAIIKKVINENTQAVADYRSGKEKALGFLVGQIMRLSKGKANPQLVNELLSQVMGQFTKEP